MTEQIDESFMTEQIDHKELVKCVIQIITEEVFRLQKMI